MQIPALTGNLKVSVNGTEVASTTFENEKVSVTIEDQGFAKKLFSMVPRKDKKLSNAHRVSKFLISQGLTLEVNDNRGSILKMGKGVRGIMGNMEFKLLRLRKYL